MASQFRLDVSVPVSSNTVNGWLRLVPGFSPESIQRIGSYMHGISCVLSGYIRYAGNTVAATSDITFLLVAAGDTVTIGSTVFTGSNSPSGTNQFQTNATPSAAADKVAAASLSSVVNLNTATSKLVTASNTLDTPTVHLVTNSGGSMGNFLPVTISAHGTVSSGPAPVNATLATASSYAALAKSAVANTGNTVLNGDLGISPGSSITGFPPGVYSGTLHQTDAAAAQAQVDATAAAVALQATGPGTDISASDLGGSTRTTGTYSASAAGTWTAGALTLSGVGPHIFLFGTSLTLPANASIILTAGATADKVYFVTGTTFTFGATNTTFGNILAGTAITTASATNHTGRLLIYGVSGTAITFPSAATINSPASAPAVAGGSEDAGVAVYNGQRTA
jgi:Ice-binding-like